LLAFVAFSANLAASCSNSSLPQGELAGERSSLLALLNVVGPTLYSQLYIQGSGKLGMNNLPFLFNIALCVAAFIIARSSLKGDEEKASDSDKQ
jgi:hypothetical protein